MKKQELDVMWSIATGKSIEINEPFTRYEFAAMVRKQVCEELATKIQAMPFGDTSASFAIWIRAQHDIEACASDSTQLKARS